jgi:hypothetical protein
MDPYIKTVWSDESLVDPERYDIKTDAGVAIESNVQIDLASTVAVAGTSATAAIMNNIEDSIEILFNNVRELLSANRTYYVRTDGSDSNTGLVDSSAGAFLTIQKAVDVAASLDINAKTVTIQVGDGTYTSPVVLRNVIGFSGQGDLIIQGNSGDIDAVTISVTNSACINANCISTIWTIKYIQVIASGSNAVGISVSNATVYFQQLVFGACASFHMAAINSGKIYILTGYSVAGASPVHMELANGVIECAGITVTYLANIAYSFADIYAAQLSYLDAYSITFTLGAYTVTGTRYIVTTNASVFTNGGGANYFPGNSAGSTSTGGQYA